MVELLFIVGNEVVGDYDDNRQALLAATKKHKKGTFLIQLVAPGKDNYTATFHSRVAVC